MSVVAVEGANAAGKGGLRKENSIGTDNRASVTMPLAADWETGKRDREARGARESDGGGSGEGWWRFRARLLRRGREDDMTGGDPLGDQRARGGCVWGCVGYGVKFWA